MDERASIVQNVVPWRVHDNLFPPTLLESIDNLINNSSYFYGWISLPGDPHGHWHREFTNTGRFNEAECAHLLPSLVFECWSFLRKGILSSHPVLLRCYLNGYTYGTDGYAHTDSEHQDCATLVWYPCKEWERDWAGETVLFDGNEIKMSVMPKRNRGFLFLSNIPHAARPVSRKCSVLRTTLMFKSRARRSDDYEFLSGFLVENGATKHKHKRGTLHDHLMRTFALLEPRVPRNVALAGGLHSVLGTNAFKHAVISDVDVIKKHFNEDVARLVYLFSTLDRPSCLERGLRPLFPRQKSQNEGRLGALPQTLRMIEAANLLDQGELDNWPKIKETWMTTTGAR